MMYSNDYERLSDWYSRNWVRIDQLQRYTKYGVITPEQYEEITGESYVG